MKKRILAFIIVLFLNNPLCADQNKEHFDFYVLMSELLNINNNRYQYKDKDGHLLNDSLRMFKELEATYIKYIDPDLENNRFSNKRLKIVAFFSFYAYHRNSAAINEYLASDLVPIYAQNRSQFLEILSELPFLIVPNCNRLNAYFGFEGKNMEGKPKFLSDNEQLIKSSLSDQARLCLNEFK